jgi:hypothetical protein
VPEAQEPFFDPLEQCYEALLVQYLGAVYLSLEHEAFGVHQQVALSAFDLLATIVTPLLSTYPGGLD